MVVDLARRLNLLRDQRETCHRLVARLPRETPRVVVRAAKTVCNDIEAEIGALLQRLSHRKTARS